MRIAVTTPTGNVGRHVVAMLVRAGVRPLVLARDPARLDPQLRDLVEATAVDQRDAASVVAATAGVDALYWVDPTTDGPDPLADYALATEAVTRAVTENRIPRTVFQSSVGAELRHGAGEIDGLAATQLALAATVGPQRSVLHLRCGFFFANLVLQLDAVRAGVVPVLLPLDLPMPWVAPRDIAEVAVTRLLSPGWSGRHVQAVHGPQDLTWSQATAIVAEAVGRPLRAERVEDDAMRAMLRHAGLGDQVVEAVLGMSTGLRDGFVPEQPRSLRTTTPTTLAAWAHAELRPLLSPA
ncbi:MAG: NAD(P)H-binding protein [Geodermatophilaceae bacterium]|nr:NAD(P)H-binding protein [Geodermatophilaceae bacterium]